MECKLILKQQKKTSIWSLLAMLTQENPHLWAIYFTKWGRLMLTNSRKMLNWPKNMEKRLLNLPTSWMKMMRSEDVESPSIQHKLFSRQKTKISQLLTPQATEISLQI